MTIFFYILLVQKCPQKCLCDQCDGSNYLVAIILQIQNSRNFFFPICIPGSNKSDDSKQVHDKKVLNIQSQVKKCL